MATKIQIRRGIASSWSYENPTLASGEIGLETDTNYIKIGNGISQWSSLPYFALPVITSASSSLIDYVDNQISALVDLSPGTLDTLNELAAAINDDPAFFTSISNTIVSASANAYYSASANTVDKINSLSAVYITQSSGITAQVASDTYLTKSSASSVYLSKTSASAQYVPISSTGVEYIQDSTSSLFTHSNHNNLTASYDDLNNKIILTASATAIFNGTTDSIPEGSTNLFFTEQRAIDSGSATYALLGMASPSGGLAGQILSKSSSANYDTIWIDREVDIVSPLLLMGA